MNKTVTENGMKFSFEPDDWKGDVKGLLKLSRKEFKSFRNATEHDEFEYWIGTDDLQSFMDSYRFFVTKNIKEKENYKMLGYRQQAPDRQFMKKRIV